MKAKQKVLYIWLTFFSDNLFCLNSTMKLKFLILACRVLFHPPRMFTSFPWQDLTDTWHPRSQLASITIIAAMCIHSHYSFGKWCRWNVPTRASSAPKAWRNASTKTKKDLDFQRSGPTRFGKCCLLVGTTINSDVPTCRLWDCCYELNCSILTRATNPVSTECNDARSPHETSKSLSFECLQATTCQRSWKTFHRNTMMELTSLSVAERRNQPYHEAFWSYLHVVEVPLYGWECTATRNNMLQFMRMQHVIQLGHCLVNTKNSLWVLHISPPHSVVFSIV